MVGDHGPGRTDNSSLAFRNDTTQGSAGPAIYDYSLDQYDTGGPAPASITSGSVAYGIYFNTSPSDPIVQGARPFDRFTQSLMDASGNIGVQWGYARDNEMLWRANASGPWNYTGVHANAGLWDGITLTLDLTNSTFGLNYFNVVANTTTTLAPAGTAMGTPMANFTGLRWRLEDGTNGGVGGKNFFDDASVSVPAPGAFALLGLGGLALGRRRR
jgi:MYXO-CTERM domain-containing protein